MSRYPDNVDSDMRTLSLRSKFEEMVAQRTKELQGNEFLFLAQIIKMNPDINLLEYQVCYAPTTTTSHDVEGLMKTEVGMKWWLEKL